MKCIIAGSRTITDYALVAKTITASGWADEITEVVCGGAGGVDAKGHRWAEERGIPVRLMLADWSRYRKAAGPIRNEQMAKYADALIYVWDGKSKGTQSMIDLATRYGLRIYPPVAKEPA